MRLKARLKASCWGDAVAVELRKAAQRVAIVNALAQFAIVPVLDAHESQRAQGLGGGDAVAPGAGLLQAALQIQADLLDQGGVPVEECVDTLQDGVEMDAQSAQFQVGEAELWVESSAHGRAPGLAVVLRTEQLVVEFTDALQGSLQFVVVVQPLLDEGFLFEGEADLLGAPAGIADGQHPDAGGLHREHRRRSRSDGGIRRRSREPRRIWVVEGRAAASLERALVAVVCFIYYNETQRAGFVNPFQNIYFKFVFASGGAGSHRNRSFIDTLR
jgi:hypothetical protein